MTDLIERLESAPEGSRELSDEVLLATGWTVNENPWERYSKLWTSPDRKHSFPEDKHPNPTRNLQDAIDWLVPEGATWEIMSYGEASVLTDFNEWKAEAATPPLTMCAAALKAMEIEK